MGKINVGWPCWDSAEKNAAKSSIENLRLSQGKAVKEFEKLWANYVGTEYAIACNSGTSGNHIAYQTLKEVYLWDNKSEIIAPANAFPSAVSPFLHMGLKVVLADINKNCLNLNIDSVSSLINSNTKAIIHVPTLGDPTNTIKLKQLCDNNNILLIVDACEAHGTKDNGINVGKLGVVSIFSFFVAHNITTGEGGMVCSDDEELINYMKSIREFGRIQENISAHFSYSDDYITNYDQRYVFMNIGHNMRMTDVLASAGIEQIKKLELFNKKRRDIVKKIISGLSDINQLSFPFDQSNLEGHSFYALPIILNSSIDRKEFCNYMEDKGIETRAIMSGNLSRQPGFRDRVEKRVDLTNADSIMENGFFIGCHPFINDSDIDYICNEINKFFLK